ncbi:MAG: hypothetical protein KDE03_12625, partial [Rhodobacteraceae bacterium]|nr:hypothetical protein [Paracoccaceae bacterium]
TSQRKSTTFTAKSSCRSSAAAHSFGTAKIEARDFQRTDTLAARQVAPALRPDHRGVGPPVGGEEHPLDRLQPPPREPEW